jgi:hypothetical protein
MFCRARVYWLELWIILAEVVLILDFPLMDRGLVMLDNFGTRVVSRIWNDKEYVPMIRINGKWLRSYGFDYGDRFEIIYNWDGSLVLRKLNQDT